MQKDSRRSFLTKAIGLGSAAVLPFVINSREQDATPAKELPSLKGRKVLFTYGGWNGHEPEKFRDYMVPWLKEEGAEVIVSDKLDPYADKTIMDTIDLVMQIFTMSQISPAQ